MHYGDKKTALLVSVAILDSVLAGSPALSRPRKAAEPPPPPLSLAPPPKQYPLGTTWVLRKFNDKPVPVAEDLTFAIDANYRGSGYAGCNTWSATVYPVKDQKLLVGPVAITHKQCDKAKMQFEGTYLTAIHSGPVWDLVNGDLVMKGQIGTLLFQRSL